MMVPTELCCSDQRADIVAETGSPVMDSDLPQLTSLKAVFFSPAWGVKKGVLKSPSSAEGQTGSLLMVFSLKLA